MKRTLILGMLIGSFVCLPSATAQTSPTWTCSSSATDMTLLGQTLSPVQANPAKTPCLSQSRGVDKVSLDEPLSGLLSPLAKLNLGVVKAATLKQGGIAPSSQAINATTSIAATDVNVPGLVVDAGVIESTVGAQCVNGQPSIGSDGRVVGLVINGQPINADRELGNVLGLPLGTILRVKLNKETRTSASLTRDAVVIDAIDVNGTPVIHLVIGHAEVGFSGDVCAGSGSNDGGTGGSGGSGDNPGDNGSGDNGGGSGGTDTGGGNGGPSTGGSPSTGGFNGCPMGTNYDAVKNVCMLTITGTGSDKGTSVISVGTPSDAPKGGRIISLATAKKRFPGNPCVAGNGPKYVVIGTSKSDRITGSNRADRIITGQGNDKVDGGRGNDCISGGTGRDILVGGLGNDRVYGESGNDAVNGNSGTDRLSGGTGSDTINTGYGRDSVVAGSGNDKINAATAGPASKQLNCGSGRDIIRYNTNEVKVLRRCEVTYSIR